MMQTIFPIAAVMFGVAGAFVALIWAVVIVVAARNVRNVVANKKGDTSKAATSTTNTTAMTATTSDAPTIAGMPEQAYYATFSERDAHCIPPQG